MAKKKYKFKLWDAEIVVSDPYFILPIKTALEKAAAYERAKGHLSVMQIYNEAWKSLNEQIEVQKYG